MSDTNFTLINFPPSITAEKDRWVFDYYEVPFHDERMTLSPYFVFKVLSNLPRFMKGPPYACNPHEKLYFRAPTEIVDHYDPLQPVERRLEFSSEDPVSSELSTFKQAASTLGNNVRLWTYSYIIQSKSLFVNSISAGAPRSQRNWVARAYSLIYQVTKKSLSPTSPNQEQRYQAISQAFDSADRLLADGRTFLAHDRLRFIDILFCVHGAPCVMPPQYGRGGVFPNVEDLPEPMQSLVQGFRERPTGRYIMNMYANHRLGFTPSKLTMD